MLIWSWKITGRVLYYRNLCKNYASTYNFLAQCLVIHADLFYYIGRHKVAADIVAGNWRSKNDLLLKNHWS